MISFVVAISVLIETKRTREVIAIERAEAERYSEELRNILELLLVRKTLIGGGMAMAIQLDDQVDENRFSQFASRFPNEDRSIINIGYVEGTRIKHVYPRPQNEHLLNVDLRDNPAQLRALNKVYETQRSTLQGPIQLLQGVPGFILRMPVVPFEEDVESSSDRDRMVAVVMDAEVLLAAAVEQAAQMTSDQSNYAVALRSDQADAPIVGDADVVTAAPLSRSLDVPGLMLRLDVAPANGWATGATPVWSVHAGLAAAGLFICIALLLARQRESERRNAQDQLSVAIENLNDGFVLYDKDNRLVVCNSRYLEIHHKCAEAIRPGAHFKDILSLGVDRGQFPEAVGRKEEWIREQLIKPTEEGRQLDVKFDQDRWMRIVERPTPDGGRVGLRIDITPQVASRIRAEKAEQTLRDAINAMPAGFWLFDADGKLALYNDFYCGLYEKSAPAIKVGATSNDVLRYGLKHGEYPEAIGREEEWLQELNDRIASGEYDWEYQLQNGRWVRSFNKPTSDGGRVGIRVDITELKLKQAELESSNAGLREALSDLDAAQKRFSDVAKISSDWFWEQDKDLRFTFLSESYDRVTGGKAQDLLGKTYAEIYDGHPNIAESADWEWLNAQQNARETFRDFVHQEVGTEDNRIWVRVSGMPITDETGTFTGYRGVGTDISVLYNAMQEAEAANLAKSDFLSIISHELRTPLTVVLGYNALFTSLDALPSVKALDTFLSENDSDPSPVADQFRRVKEEVGGYAQKVDKSGKHLLALINQILHLSKIDSGSLEIERQVFALGPVVSTVVEEFQILAKEKSIRLEDQTQDLEVFADETHVRQILINLVGNALKFTDQGHVRISTEKRDTEVVIRVADTGCGISKEDAGKIFEQFSQVDSSSTRAKGGSGLGLTISRRLVELQGGVLTVDSTLGKAASSASPSRARIRPFWKSDRGGQLAPLERADPDRVLTQANWYSGEFRRGNSAQ